MPEPMNYDNESDFMSACVPMMMDEGRDNEQAAAACMMMWKEKSINTDTFVFSGAEVKALGDGKVGGYLIRYGNPKDVDLEGDFFSSGTEYGVADGSSLPIFYNHGMDGTVKNKRIGRGVVKFDNAGMWLEAQLEMRDEYEKMIYQLAENGKLGWSSGAAGHLVERERVGKAYHVKSWPVAEGSLTPSPAEPRNHAVTLKSLIDLEAASADKSKTAGKSREPLAGHPAKENDMDEKELKAMLEASNKTFTDALEANQKALLDKVTEQAEAAATKAVENVLDKLPEVKAKLNGRIEVTVDEADREFESIGDNCIAVYQHAKGIKTHPRIRGLQAKAIAAAQVAGDKSALEVAYKAALGSNEAIPSQGEFLLEPTITSTLLKPMHETGIFSTKVNRLPVGPNSNSGWINGVDETNRASGSRWGGVRGYHSAEAATMTASQPKFRRINWELHKIYVLQYATDELLADAGMLTAIINQSSAEEFDFMVNDDILNGIGVDRPVGVLNAGNLISVGRYTANKVNHVDLVNMWQRLIPRMKGGAEWYINSEVEPQLQKLAFTSNAATTEMMSPFVSYRPDGTLTIFGKGVNTTEFNAALGTAGDIGLFNFSDYLFWEKGAVEAAMSIHVQFLTDQTAFRFIARYDGQSAQASAITPYKGTNTQSPFVTLASTTG
jgi:HK97 family phage major capsid protein